MTLGRRRPRRRRAGALAAAALVLLTAACNGEDDDEQPTLAEAVDATIDDGFRYRATFLPGGTGEETEPGPDAVAVEVGLVEPPDRSRRVELASEGPGGSEVEVEVITVDDLRWTRREGGRWEREQADGPLAGLEWLTDLASAEVDGDRLTVDGREVGAVWKGDHVEEVRVSVEGGVVRYDLYAHGDVDPIEEPGLEQAWEESVVAEDRLAGDLQVRPVEGEERAGCQPVPALEPATPAVLPLALDAGAEEGQVRCLLLGPAEVVVPAGAAVRVAVLDGEHRVFVTLDPATAPDAARTFAAHLGERVGLVSDGVLLSAPVVQSPRPGDTLVVPGLPEEVAFALFAGSVSR